MTRISDDVFAVVWAYLRVVPNGLYDYREPLVAWAVCEWSHYIRCVNARNKGQP